MRVFTQPRPLAEAVLERLLWRKLTLETFISRDQEESHLTG